MTVITGSPRRKATLYTVAPVALVAGVACANDPAPTGTAGTVGLNDVSVLLPLPPPGHADLLLKPTDTGAHGRLLPDFALPAPALVQSEDRAVTATRLRVVAMRLDPCFPQINRADRAGCEAVLNLMWQPVVDNTDAHATTMSTADAAVHTFHTLAHGELAAMVSEALALEPGHTVDVHTPLGVHPVIAQEGLDGPYHTAWKAMVLRHAGEDNLTRMTFLALRANVGNAYVGVGWLMSGAEFSNGQVSAVVVSGTHDMEQHFGNNVTTTLSADQVESYVGDFFPATASTHALLPIMADSTRAMTLPLDQVQSAVDAALRLENPLETTQATVDCVSCHVATTARLWAERNRGIDTRNSPGRYRSSTFDLSLQSQVPTRTNSLRGLGYYGAAVALSQRTVNDTAASADFINQHVLAR